MTVPNIPADDQPYTLDAALGYNSRGELAQCSTIEFTCEECGTSYEVDVAATIPPTEVVIADNSAEHARELRDVARGIAAGGFTSVAALLHGLANSWHREG